MLVLAAPVFPLGRHPGRVVPRVVGHIENHCRRRMAPALPEQRSFAAWLLTRGLRIWPPEFTIMAPQIPVFPRHANAPRAACQLLGNDRSRLSCRMLAWMRIRRAAMRRLP